MNALRSNSTTSGLFRTNWTGTWHGVVDTHPKEQLGQGWHKTIVIGPYPMTDETCTIWSSQFTEQGIVQLAKDYRLCRGHSPEDLYIDEGNGGRMTAQWLHDVLIAPFKYNGVFTVSSLRLRGDTLEEEVLITDDRTGPENMVVSMRALSLHQIKMKQITEQV